MASNPLTLLSWNVNGVRALLRKGGGEALAALDAEVVCLQETKIDPVAVSAIDLPLWPYQTWHCALKKGYSGTAILSKVEPLSVSTGLGSDFPDEEGRVITTEFAGYFLVNVYTPNAQDGLRRLRYRIDAWDGAFRIHLRRLSERKPVVFCGDLNVAHQRMDIARPDTNHKSPGFTDEERESFGKHLSEGGFVDGFRHLYPEAAGRYTWWSMRGGARARNVGWRIDYFCLSKSLTALLEDVEIFDRIEGSDHCPVRLKLRF